MSDHSNNDKAPRSIDRRRFIQAGSLLGLGSFMLPKDLFCNKPAPVVLAGDCAPTTDDIQGPFYRAGAPNTSMVAGVNEPGTRLFISGSVLSNDCLTPVAGALVEVWQANAAAVYSSAPSFNLRGSMLSDSNGLYAFESIMPGAYLNGNQFRPKHIHYKVSKPGFPTLVTQLYFEGDEFIAADPWASQLDATARIIPLNTIGGGQLEGSFDIVLDGFVGIKPNRFGEDGYLMPAYPNPSADLTSIHFNVFRKANVRVMITDIDGRELVRLINENMPQGRFTTQWNGLNAAGAAVAAGSYLATLFMDDKAVISQRIVRQ